MGAYNSSQRHKLFKYAVIFVLMHGYQNIHASQESILGNENLKSVDDFKAGSAGIDRSAMPGATLFKDNCLDCHNGSVPRAPHQQWLELMDAHTLNAALAKGVMKTQALHLSSTQREQITAYITFGAESFITDEQYPSNCKNQQIKFDLGDIPPRINWGHDTSRYVPAGVAQLAAKDIPKLRLKWAYAYPGANRARSQPSAGWGSVFVGSQDGKVYALDLETGCEHWRFQASAEVRTGIVLSDGQDSRPMIFFGDILAKAYALDALTGELIWQQRTHDHPSATLTGTPAFESGVLYIPISSLEVIPAADPNYECCTFRGKVLAVNAQTGREIWSSWIIPKPAVHAGETSIGTRIFAPSISPIWRSPLIDSSRFFHHVGTGENYSSPSDDSSDAVHALDLKSGKQMWKKQTTAKDAWNVACMIANNPNCPKESGVDMDFGSSIILIKDNESGKEILVAGQKNGMVYGLDPDKSGEMLWRQRLGRGGIQGGVHFGMAAEAHQIYVPIADNGESPPNYDYQGPAQGGMHSIDGRTGDILWTNLKKDICGDVRPYCAPGISAAVTSFPGHVIAGHLDGHLRIYSSSDGSVVWGYDTAKTFKTIAGFEGIGGGISGGGPILHKGHLIANSGYGLYFHEPGNVLLVFSAEGT